MMSNWIPEIDDECEYSDTVKWHSTRIVSKFVHNHTQYYVIILDKLHIVKIGNIRKIDPMREIIRQDIVDHWNDDNKDCPINDFKLAQHLLELGYTRPTTPDDFIKADIFKHMDTSKYIYIMV